MPRQPNKKCNERIAETNEPSSWSEDQKLREYYYDDSHGYEDFDPDDREDDDEESDSDD